LPCSDRSFTIVAVSTITTGSVTAPPGETAVCCSDEKNAILASDAASTLNTSTIKIGKTQRLQITIDRLTSLRARALLLFNLSADRAHGAENHCRGGKAYL